MYKTGWLLQCYKSILTFRVYFDFVEVGIFWPALGFCTLSNVVYSDRLLRAVHYTHYILLRYYFSFVCQDIPCNDIITCYFSIVCQDIPCNVIIACYFSFVCQKPVSDSFGCDPRWWRTLQVCGIGRKTGSFIFQIKNFFKDCTIWWRMLKQPGLISSVLHLSLL